MLKTQPNRSLSTFALVLTAPTGTQPPQILCTLSNDYEIELLEQGIQTGEANPLASIHQFRTRKSKQEEEFENYLETTLSNPTVSQKVRNHGIRWLHSRNKMEAHQQKEADAAQVIADLAYPLYLKDPNKTDFFMTNEHTHLRIRIFLITQLSTA